MRFDGRLDTHRAVHITRKIDSKRGTLVMHFAENSIVRATNLVVPLAAAILLATALPMPSSAQLGSQLCEPSEEESVSSVIVPDGGGALVRLHDRGVEMVRTIDTTEQPSSRHVIVELNRAEFPLVDLDRANVNVMRPGDSPELSGRTTVQGGIHTVRRPIGRCEEGNGACSHRIRFDWPRRAIQWRYQPHPSHLSDVVRIVLEAPPTEEEWIRRMQRDGILQASESGGDISRRIALEAELTATPTREWLAVVSDSANTLRPSLIDAIAESRARDTRTEMITTSRTRATRTERSTRPRTRATSIEADIEARIEAGVEARIEARINALKNVVDDAWSSLRRYAHPTGEGELHRRLTQLTVRIENNLSSSGSAEERLERLRQTAELLASFGQQLRTPSTLASQTNWAAFKLRACDLRRPSPIASYDVVEDELFPRQGRHTRVIDFDYTTGYVARSDDYFYIDEGDQLFIRVHGVPRGQSVAVSWNEHIVSTTRSERGLDGMRFAQDPSTQPADQTTSQRVQLNADALAHGDVSSALVLRVGEVETGRYTFSVCRGDTSDQCARSGHHTLDVQGERWWGFRAGFGVSIFARVERLRATRITEGSFRVEQSFDRAVQRPSIPFLATIYPFENHRRQIMRNSFDLGISAGVNLLRPHREYYFGATLGGGPASIFLGYAILRSSVARGSAEDFLQSSDGIPNLIDTYGRRTVYDHGITTSVTFDFDVFRRLYRAVSTSNIPGLGAGGGGQ